MTLRKVLELSHRIKASNPEDAKTYAALTGAR